MSKGGNRFTFSPPGSSEVSKGRYDPRPALPHASRPQHATFPAPAYGPNTAWKPTRPLPYIGRPHLIAPTHPRVNDFDVKRSAWSHGNLFDTVPLEKGPIQMAQLVSRNTRVGAAPFGRPNGSRRDLEEHGLDDKEQCHARVRVKTTNDFRDTDDWRRAFRQQEERGCDTAASVEISVRPRVALLRSTLSETHGVSDRVPYIDSNPSASSMSEPHPPHQSGQPPPNAAASHARSPPTVWAPTVARDFVPYTSPNLLLPSMQHNYHASSSASAASMAHTVPLIPFGTAEFRAPGEGERAVGGVLPIRLLDELPAQPGASAWTSCHGQGEMLVHAYTGPQSSPQERYLFEEAPELSQGRTAGVAEQRKEGRQDARTTNSDDVHDRVPPHAFECHQVHGVPPLASPEIDERSHMMCEPMAAPAPSPQVYRDALPIAPVDILCSNRHISLATHSQSVQYPLAPSSSASSPNGNALRQVYDKLASPQLPQTREQTLYELFEILLRLLPPSDERHPASSQERASTSDMVLHALRAHSSAQGASCAKVYDGANVFYTPDHQPAYAARALDETAPRMASSPAEVVPTTSHDPNTTLWATMPVFPPPTSPQQWHSSSLPHEHAVSPRDTGTRHPPSHAPNEAFSTPMSHAHEHAVSPRDTGMRHPPSHAPNEAFNTSLSHAHEQVVSPCDIETQHPPPRAQNEASSTSLSHAHEQVVTPRDIGTQHAPPRGQNETSSTSLSHAHEQVVTPRDIGTQHPPPRAQHEAFSTSLSHAYEQVVTPRDIGTQHPSPRAQNEAFSTPLLHAHEQVVFPRDTEMRHPPFRSQNEAFSTSLSHVHVQAVSPCDIGTWRPLSRAQNEPPRAHNEACSAPLSYAHEQALWRMREMLDEAARGLEGESHRSKFQAAKAYPCGGARRPVTPAGEIKVEVYADGAQTGAYRLIGHLDSTMPGEGPHQPPIWITDCDFWYLENANITAKEGEGANMAPTEAPADASQPHPSAPVFPAEIPSALDRHVYANPYHSSVPRCSDATSDASLAPLYPPSPCRSPPAYPDSLPSPKLAHATSSTSVAPPLLPHVDAATSDPSLAPLYPPSPCRSLSAYPDSLPSPKLAHPTFSTSVASPLLPHADPTARIKAPTNAYNPGSWHSFTPIDAQGSSCVGWGFRASADDKEPTPLASDDDEGSHQQSSADSSASAGHDLTAFSFESEASAFHPCRMSWALRMSASRQHSTQEDLQSSQEEQLASEEDRPLALADLGEADSELHSEVFLSECTKRETDGTK